MPIRDGSITQGLEGPSVSEIGQDPLAGFSERDGVSLPAAQDRDSRAAWPRKFFSVKVADDFFLKVFGFVFRFVFC
jgi:hypothetical protein